MGKQKVVVSERDNIATLFDNDRAVEFIINRGDTLLGDVYLGTVENILPSIDAAFVNIGGSKMAFLHSSDVKGRGDLQKRIKPGQKMIVQVIKEPTGHKGPRVTTNISMPGRFLVFMPDSRGISISRKIEQQNERSRLKSIVSMVKPHGVGVIIRTEANGQREQDLQEDFEILMERWQSIVNAADAAAKHCLLYRDQDLLYRVIREVVNDEVDEIAVDTAFGQQRAQQLLQTWNMDNNIKVTLHDTKQSIMVAQGVEREIKLALQTKVPLPSGGYLYIQPTEALTVVDVNSGKFTRLDSQAETIRLTNLEACKEIARQLRLRNIGGMIVVDFIDMESRADQLSILEAFDKELAPDKSKPQMGQLTDLGLVEMTRHRQGQALSEIFSKECPMCSGKGHAIEQFHWSPANAEAESKLFGRSKGNVPFKVQQRGRGYKSQSLKPKVTPSMSLEHTQKKVRDIRSIQAGDNGAEKPATVSGADTPGPLFTNKRPRLDLKTIEPHFDADMAANLGRPFAKTLKIAFTPDRYNRTLSRMSTTANDFMSLVASVQAGGLDISQLLDDPSPEGQAQAEQQQRQHGRNDGQHDYGGQQPQGPPQAPAAAPQPVEGKAPVFVDPAKTHTRRGEERGGKMPGFLSSFFKRTPPVVEEEPAQPVPQPTASDSAPRRPYAGGSPLGSKAPQQPAGDVGVVKFTPDEANMVDDGPVRAPHQRQAARYVDPGQKEGPEGNTSDDGGNDADGDSRNNNRSRRRPSSRRRRGRPSGGGSGGGSRS